MVVPITRYTPNARARARTFLGSVLSRRLLVLHRAFAVISRCACMNEKEEEEEEENKTGIHEFNEPCAEFIAAG